MRINLGKIKNSLKSDYIKNFGALAGSEGIAQVIQIAVSPILARIYTPIEFGQYELFKNITLLLVVIGFLQYDVAIYSGKSDKESINALALSSIILFKISILVFFLVLIFNNTFIKITGTEVKEGWTWSLPIYLFFSGATTLLLNWMTKLGSFVLLSKIKILISILVAVTQLLFGFLKWGYWGLVYSTIIVQIIAFFVYFTSIYKHIRKDFNLIEKNSLKQTFFKNWRLPVLVLPGNFLNNFVQTLPVFFLGRIDQNLLGYYALARRIIDFPLKFITAAVQRLYINELSQEVISTGRAEKTFNKNLKLFSIIGGGLFLGILLFTKPLLPLLFGPQWTPAIPYIIILGFLFSIRFIFGGLSFIMILGKAPKFDIYWQLGFGILVYLSFWISQKENISSINTILIYVSVSSLAYLIYGYICKKVSLSENILKL